MKKKFYLAPGQRYGRWTLISFVGKKDKRGHARWLCRCDCGTTRTIEAYGAARGISLSCGCLQKEIAAKTCRRLSGDKHWAWKGGKSVDKNGYVRIYVDKGNSTKSRPFEHLCVMENYLGRPLLLSETVHHKNGMRADNRIENLELWASNHPSGQRVSDLVIWARELLRLYGGLFT